MTKETSKSKNYQSPIRNGPGKILLLHKIEHASYYGGDLTGKHIISLSNYAHDVSGSFHKELMKSTRNGRYLEVKIRKNCDKTKELCILLDPAFFWQGPHQEKP